jgi:hypothetical protein
MLYFYMFQSTKLCLLTMKNNNPWYNSLKFNKGFCLSFVIPSSFVFLSKVALEQDDKRPPHKDSREIEL